MFLQLQDFGQLDYQKAWDQQQSLMDKLHVLKGLSSYPSDPFAGWFAYVEHPHVYTLGKSGSENNLLLNYIQLQAHNACFVRTNRGGDITYHGPGQIVGYPIIDLEKTGLTVRKYIFLMEEAIIKTMQSYGLDCERLDGATGVWLEPKTAGKARKICAIGVRVSRFVTMHGFALNVNTDLSYFGHINPCGFTDKAVTSMEKECGEKIQIQTVKEKLLASFSDVWGVEFKR